MFCLLVPMSLLAIWQAGVGLKIHEMEMQDKLKVSFITEFMVTECIYIKKKITQTWKKPEQTY